MSAATVAPVVTRTAVAAKSPFRPSPIQSYPFKDPDLDEVIRLMRKGSELLKSNEHDEARGHFEQAREIWKGWLCQESYLRTVKDIKPGADAILVGSYLEEFAKSIK